MKKGLRNRLSMFAMVVIVVGLGTVIGGDVVVKEGTMPLLAEWIQIQVTNFMYEMTNSLLVEG